jgi:hypothetical protein
MVQASADSNEGTILEFEGMVGVSGQFVGAMGTPIRGRMAAACRGSSRAARVLSIPLGTWKLR